MWEDTANKRWSIEKNYLKVLILKRNNIMKIYCLIKNINAPKFYQSLSSIILIINRVYKKKKIII